MGYSTGPTPHRHPGDADRPGQLVGHLPAMTSIGPSHGWVSKVDELFGRTCIVLVFVTWVVVPICGGLSLLLR